ncbi:MAG: T9SS type A sorting domain-containing protein [Paludibacter sp.]|nr:T9SS type A sorting domain-containing protein [Paludibacter sp.]
MINGATTVAELNANDLQLSAYPNPFAQSVRISYEAATTNSGVNILNALGQRVFSSNAHTSGDVSFCWNAKSTNGNSLPNGLYMVCVTDGNRKQVRKIVLER